MKIFDREKKPEPEPTVKVDSEHAFCPNCHAQFEAVGHIKNYQPLMYVAEANYYILQCPNCKTVRFCGELDGIMKYGIIRKLEITQSDNP